MSKEMTKALGAALRAYGAMDAFPLPGSDAVLYFGVRQRGPADDVIGAVRWADKGLQIEWGLGTTEPTGYWLRNPMREKGAFVLADGIHRGFFSKGLHRGKYPAMRQAGTAIGWRDGDRNGEVDYNGLVPSTGTGINLHHGSGEKASAGCQVLVSSETRAEIVSWAEEGREYAYLLVDIDSRPNLRPCMIDAFPEMRSVQAGWGLRFRARRMAAGLTLSDFGFVKPVRVSAIELERSRPTLSEGEHLLLVVERAEKGKA